MSILVLQDLRVQLKAAIELADEITARFAVGDSAPDLVENLAARVAQIGLLRSQPDFPELAEDEFSRLKNLLTRAVSLGEHWLSEEGGPALESAAGRERIVKAYRQ